MILATLLIGGSLGAAEPSMWKPNPITSWQWQLTGTVDTSVDAEMFDIDLFNNDASVVAALHAKGKRVVCYLSVGTFEDWRPDAAQFPDAVKGKPLDDFPNEKWLDIRRIDVLGPIMEARLDMCKAKGFDAVEPDNVDGYTNKSGFTLTAADQLRYNQFIAAAAHARGLSVGLKNDLDQVAELEPYFDWALNEQCFQYKECSVLSAFVNAGKAVFNVEYKLTADKFCTDANTQHFNSMRKGIDLDASRTLCPAVTAPVVTAMVNAASLRPGGVAPSEIVTLFGANFGAAGDGNRVLFDGNPAPVIYWSPAQVSVLAPKAFSSTTSKLVLDRAGTSAQAFTATVASAAPGLFTVDASGTGTALAVAADGSVISPSNPAPKGAVVTFYATGLNEGAAFELKIGGATAEVLNLAYDAGGMAGLTAITVRIPAALDGSGALAVTLTAGKNASQSRVAVFVAPGA